MSPLTRRSLVRGVAGVAPVSLLLRSGDALTAATVHDRGTRGCADQDDLARLLACNRQRIAHRRRAHEDGAWVREAALAFAEKQEAGA